MSDRARSGTGGGDARKGTALAVVSSFWAAAFLIPFGAASKAAPPQSVALAMLLCAAVIGTVTTPWFAARRGAGVGAPRPLGRANLLTAAILGACTVVGNIAMAAALTRVEAALTSVLLQTEILFVAGLAALFLGERITLRFAAGTALALTGFAIMRLPGAGSAAIDLGGAAAAATAAVCFGVMHVATRLAIRRIEPRAVNALRLWLAVGFLALLPGNAGSLAALDARAWALAASAAFCGPFLGRLSVMYSVRYIPAAHARLAGLLAPVFAFALGFAAFFSMPSYLELFGGAVILAGVAVPLVGMANEG